MLYLGLKRQTELYIYIYILSWPFFVDIMMSLISHVENFCSFLFIYFQWPDIVAITLATVYRE